MPKSKPKVVIRYNRFRDKGERYEIWIVNGVQSFRLACQTRTKRQCEWYKRMLKKAGVG